MLNKILSFLFAAFWIWIIFSTLFGDAADSIEKSAKDVETKGLKNVLNEIWEGSGVQEEAEKIWEGTDSTQTAMATKETPVYSGDQPPEFIPEKIWKDDPKGVLEDDCEVMVSGDWYKVKKVDLEREEAIVDYGGFEIGFSFDRIEKVK